MTQEGDVTDASRPPNIDAVVECAHLFARELEVNPLPDAVARSVIEEALFGRKDGWAGCELGIITREELMNLVLAHLQSELETQSECAPSQYPQGAPWERPGLRDALRKALFES